MQAKLIIDDSLAIENPVGIMSTVWRKPDQIIQPWQFGHGDRSRLRSKTYPGIAKAMAENSLDAYMMQKVINKQNIIDKVV